MADFLRDEYIKDISLDENALVAIARIFGERLESLKYELKKEGDTEDKHRAFLTYIIRFDNKGYRLWDIHEVLGYFRQAEEVERVLFTLESEEAVSTGRKLGAYLELAIDAKDENKCTLVSSSNTRDWAESSFSETKSYLSTHKTRNGYMRSWWMSLIIQLAGAGLVFATSLWISIQSAPLFKLDSAFLVVFIFSMLTLSIMWGHASNHLNTKLQRLFPNAVFERYRSKRWLLEGLVVGLVTGVVIWTILKVANWISNAVKPYLA